MEIARKAYPDCLIRDGLVSHWDQGKQKYFVLMEFGEKCSSNETLALIALSLFLQVFSFFSLFPSFFLKNLIGYFSAHQDDVSFPKSTRGDRGAAELLSCLSRRVPETGREARLRPAVGLGEDLAFEQKLFSVKHTQGEGTPKPWEVQGGVSCLLIYP